MDKKTVYQKELKYLKIIWEKALTETKPWRMLPQQKENLISKIRDEIVKVINTPLSEIKEDIDAIDNPAGQAVLVKLQTDLTELRDIVQFTLKKFEDAGQFLANIAKRIKEMRDDIIEFIPSLKRVVMFTDIEKYAA